MMLTITMLFPTGDTDYRNPLLAEIMHHLAFAQRFGLGVPIAREALAATGNPERLTCIPSRACAISARR